MGWLALHCLRHFEFPVRYRHLGIIPRDRWTQFGGMRVIVELCFDADLTLNLGTDIPVW